MPLDIEDDEYVARLLAQDAKKSTKTYDLVGLDAFNPKRARSGAPKPNTNFLRHIIRQTDNHNAALLAKEAEESSSRLRQMNRERAKGRTEAVDRTRRKIEGRLSPPPDDEDSRTRRSRRSDDHTGVEDDRRRERKRKHRDDRSPSRSRKHRDSTQDRQRRKRRHEDGEDDRGTHGSGRSRDCRDRDRRSRYDSEEEAKRSHRRNSYGRSRRTQRSHSRSSDQSRSESPRQKTTKKHKHHERSRSPRRSSRSRTQRSATPASGSDPLEAILGPLPPPAEPVVRSRGRGALKANSMGIESRFSSTYDPSMDMRPDSDAEDDWGEALEVMRDRERWKQQGADRLRAAGFKDEQVKKWEQGGDPTEEDVVWSKRGQSREWDRGKIVDKDGDVELKAEWGRLK